MKNFLHSVFYQPYAAMWRGTYLLLLLLFTQFLLHLPTSTSTSLFAIHYYRSSFPKLGLEVKSKADGC
ncbi:MAG TPA: hypothetical protein VN763_04925 [Saprospiraceae bacterium]|nr:hypothetical protein [Saprospiraceae bacterium]